MLKDWNKWLHSLRATAASRLYHNGIDEQLTMERREHKSIDGVQSYKRTNDEQVAISKVLDQSAQFTCTTPTENDQTKASILSGLQLHNCSNMNVLIIKLKINPSYAFQYHMHC